MTGDQKGSKNTGENFINKLKRQFLTCFGDIKVFRWPMFIVYDPGSYLIKGELIREVINLIEPGDILLRKYKNYLIILTTIKTDQLL